MLDMFPLEDEGINDLKIYTYVHKSVLILISCFVCAFMCHCRGVTGWVFCVPRALCLSIYEDLKCTGPLVYILVLHVAAVQTLRIVLMIYYIS